MKSLAKWFLSVAPLILCASAPTLASANLVVLPLSGWYTSRVLMPGPGGFFPDSFIGYPGQPSPEFTVEVQLTGYWDNTDQYEVYVNGNLALTTRAISPPAVAVDYGMFGAYTTPDQAYPNCPGSPCDKFTSGIVLTNIGDVITVRDIGPLFFDAAASGLAGADRYDAQVALEFGGLLATPEPGLYIPLGAGLIGVVAWRRRMMA